MNAVNIERDEKAEEAAMYLSNFCKDHPNCKGCIFSFSQICVLKWTKPDQWDESVTKVLQRRNVSRYTDSRGDKNEKKHRCTDQGGK